MSFRRGQRVEIYKGSEDEAWQSYMNEYIGLHGVIVDPDTSVNDPDALLEVSIVGKGTFRLPQDCLKTI